MSYIKPKETMSKTNKNEGFGEPPPELEEIGIHRWKEISGYLESKGISGSEYRGALLILCQAYEDHAEFRKNVKRVGSTIASERGTTRNPDCLNVNNAAGTIAKLSAQFGLTPSSQGKIKSSGKKKDANPFLDV